MYSLPKLSYSYSALEPYIDAKTMEIHHTKHHAAYIDNLNKALEKVPQWKNRELEEIFRNINDFSEEIKTIIINNGGGHYNHSFFWQIMGPKNQVKPEPEGDLKKAIEKNFGSFEKFRELFSKTALSLFGSGWAWLGLQRNGNLIVHSTPNQNPPLMEDLIPLIGVDVWEHAYYLKYQNRRAEYIENWWNVVNWKRAEEIYLKNKL